MASLGKTTYYIDPVVGDDASSGLGVETPWRTFGPINRLRLAAGDRVVVRAAGPITRTLALAGAGTPDEPIEVVFAAGRYDWFPDELLRRTFNISNTNAEPEVGKAIAILLDGARCVKISGPGAEIVCRGKMMEVCIDGAEDVMIADLAFDYHRPTVSEWTVSAAGEDWAELQIHPDSAYEVVGGKIVWVGEGWTEQSGLAQELDPTTDEVWRRRDPLEGLVLAEVAPGRVRAAGRHGMTAGRVYQIRNPYRDYAGVFCRRSRNITWKDVKFRFLHGMGVVSQFSEDLTFDGVAIAPDPASGRTTAAWADCLHLSGCRGKVVVKDCLFSGAHDDAINIHGTHLRVIERVSATQVLVRFMHRQTYGFLAFNPGDEITFVRWDSLRTYGPNEVVAAELQTPTDILLTLARPAPADIAEDDALENLAWTPEVEIRGCRVRHIPTRGFLTTTWRKVLIEGNVFDRTHMSAILVAHDAASWFESGPVRDMTVRGNTFYRCAEPVVRIKPENTVPNAAVHRNLRIEGNAFLLRDAVAVGAKSTTGLTVTGNAIYAERDLDDGAMVRTEDCADVTVKANHFAPASQWQGKPAGDSDGTGAP